VTLNPVEVIDWRRDRLADFRCPVGVDVVGALPRSASGKLLKRQLREEYQRQ